MSLMMISLNDDHHFDLSKSKYLNQLSFIMLIAEFLITILYK